jgi:hypothetical protein
MSVLISTLISTLVLVRHTSSVVKHRPGTGQKPDFDGTHVNTSCAPGPADQLKHSHTDHPAPMP